MTTLSAPERSGRREEARALLAAVPEDLTGQALSVEFGAEARTTPSFIDELLIAVLRDRGAAMLILTGLSEDVRRLAVDAAADLDLMDRLSFD